MLSDKIERDKEKEIEDILFFLEFSEKQRPNDCLKNSLKGIKYIEPLGTRSFEDHFNTDKDFWNNIYSMEEAGIDDFNYSFLCDDFLSQPGEGLAYEVYNLKTIKHKEARGKVRAFFPTMAAMTIIDIYRDYTYSTEGLYYYGYIGNGEWVLAGNGHRGKRDYMEGLELGNVLLSIAIRNVFFRYYEWTASVYSGLGKCLVFPTDPIGARELFKLRDIPEGKERRIAIRNWVSSHWRNYNGNQVEIDPFMRGAFDFGWKGFNVKITPSMHDIDKLRRIKAQ